MIFIFFFVIAILSGGGGFVVYNECAFGYLNGFGRFRVVCVGMYE